MLSLEEVLEFAAYWKMEAEEEEKAFEKARADAERKR